MTAIRRNWWMLLLIAVCVVIVMASVIDDHSVALKKQIRLIPQKGFYYTGTGKNGCWNKSGFGIEGVSGKR